MADGIIRPRPQPLGRYLAIRAAQPLARPFLAVVIVLVAMADLGHLDTVGTIAGHWQGIVQGALVLGALAPVAGGIALGVVAKKRSESHSIETGNPQDNSQGCASSNPQANAVTVDKNSRVITPLEGRK